MNWFVPHHLQKELELQAAGLATVGSGLDLASELPHEDTSRRHIVALRSAVSQVLDNPGDWLPLHDQLAAFIGRVDKTAAHLRDSIVEFPAEAEYLCQHIEAYERMLEGLHQMAAWFDEGGQDHNLWEGLAVVEGAAQDIDLLLAEGEAEQPDMAAADDDCELLLVA